MQSTLFIILTLIIYFIVFIFGDKPNFYAENKPSLEQSALQSEENKPTVEEYKKEKDTFKIPPLEKVKYPETITSGSIKFFIINPTIYTAPSKVTRTKACGALFSAIENAKEEVNFAIYSADYQAGFLDALNGAYSKGVVLKGVADSAGNGTVGYFGLNKFRDLIKISYDNNKAFMHNKFFIIDNKIVMTGTMNVSNNDCSAYNGNNFIVIEDKKLASIYKKEFEQMHSGKFKDKKENFSANDIILQDGTRVSVYFSPVGSTYEKVISPKIKSAKKEIRLSAFVLTHNGVTEDLINAVKRGVKVKIIEDAVFANKTKDKIKYLRENGALLKVENMGGKNHEKTITIDNDTIITGSANFSFSGYSKNDENLLVINNTEITTFYNKYFDLLFSAIGNIYLTKIPRAESVYSINSCTDGLDNNYDGKIDSNDEGCKIH